MIVEREIPIYRGFSHIPSVFIEDTGFGSCVVLVKFLESDMFIDTESTPFVFRRLVLEGIHRMPLRLLHKDAEVRIYLGGVSVISRYLDAFCPPATSTTSRDLIVTINRYYARTCERSIIVVHEMWETSSQTRSEEE